MLFGIISILFADRLVLNSIMIRDVEVLFWAVIETKYLALIYVSNLD